MMYGVYRVRSDGGLSFVSRTITTNEKLAREIAADLSVGEFIRPDGTIGYCRPHPHVARAISPDFTVMVYYRDGRSEAKYFDTETSARIAAMTIVERDDVTSVDVLDVDGKMIG